MSRIGFRVTDEDVRNSKPIDKFMELDGPLSPKSRPLQRAAEWRKVEERGLLPYSDRDAKSVDDETFPIGVRDGTIYIPWLDLGGVLTGPVSTLRGDRLWSDANVKLVQTALTSGRGGSGAGACASYRKRLGSEMPSRGRGYESEEEEEGGEEETGKITALLPAIDRYLFSAGDAGALMRVVRASPTDDGDAEVLVPIAVENLYRLGKAKGKRRGEIVEIVDAIKARFGVELAMRNVNRFGLSL